MSDNTQSPTDASLVLSLPYIYSLKPGKPCYLGYPSETHLQLKSHEIFHPKHQFQLPICSEILYKVRQCCSITAMHCAKFQNYWTTEKWVIGKQNYLLFQHPQTGKNIQTWEKKILECFNSISVPLYWESANLWIYQRTVFYVKIFIFSPQVPSNYLNLCLLRFIS